MSKNKLTHTDEAGKAQMVDVSQKPSQMRIARAYGFIQLEAQTIELIKNNAMKKGDVLTVAEIAGIQAAKQTSNLIPLCHNLIIEKVEVKAQLQSTGVAINSMVKCIGRTGVEMEALIAASISLLTIYDMCKAVDKNMKITDTHLLEKNKIEINM